jgi:hypothetical protein
VRQCEVTPCFVIADGSGVSVKLPLHEACRERERERERSQVGRLLAPSYLPRVNVYLPEIRNYLYDTVAAILEGDPYTDRFFSISEQEQGLGFNVSFHASMLLCPYTHVHKLFQNSGNQMKRETKVHFCVMHEKVVILCETGAQGDT